MVQEEFLLPESCIIVSIYMTVPVPDGMKT